MKGKILFVAGLGLGYWLGTRAGRETPEPRKSRAMEFWHAPPRHTRAAPRASS